MTAQETHGFVQEISRLNLEDFPSKSEATLRWIGSLLLPLTASQAEGIIQTLALLGQFGFTPKWEPSRFARCVQVRPLTRANVLWAYVGAGRWKHESGDWEPLSEKPSNIRTIPVKSEFDDSGPSLPPAA
jgi:hypothetical protein